MAGSSEKKVGTTLLSSITDLLSEGQSDRYRIGKTISYNREMGSQNRDLYEELSGRKSYVDDRIGSARQADLQGEMGKLLRVS